MVSSFTRIFTINRTLITSRRKNLQHVLNKPQSLVSSGLRDGATPACALFGCGSPFYTQSLFTFAIVVSVKKKRPEERFSQTVPTFSV